MTTASPTQSDSAPASPRVTPDRPDDRATLLPPIAYLNTEYPSLSHTFIEREIRALRERGVRITTFSVRPPGKHATIGAAHSAAAAETTSLIDRAPRLARRVLAACLRSPLGAARAVLRSQRLAPPGLSSRLRHIAYAIEGIRLAEEMRRAGLFHVHVHMANNGAAVALLACAYDTKLTYSLSIHGSAEFFHIDSWTLRDKVENAVFVRCISNFCRAQIMAWCDPSYWPRLAVVRCGIDTDHFTAAPRPRGAPLKLLTVGRLHPIKAYSLLLESCAQLASHDIDWTLTVVGDGPMRAELKASASRLRIGDRVKFTGAVSQDDLLPYLRAADAMVVSSCMEGVPVVLMEAMATGLVVVSTNVGGIPELVPPGAGVLTPPGSAAELTRAIIELAAKRPEWDSMAAAARARVVEAYDIRHTARGMHELFEAYLGRPPGRPA